MKSLLLFLACFACFAGNCLAQFFGGLTPPSNPLSTPPPGSGGPSYTNNTSGLIAWWPLDETSGPTAHDASGYGNDGAWEGSVGAITGVITNGILLGGSPQDVLVSSPQTALRQPASFSVLVWLKASSASGYEEVCRFHDDGWFLVINTTPALALAPTGAEYSQTGCGFLTDGAWHHYAATFDGSAVTMYRDGTNISSYSAGATSSSTGGLYIGSLQNAAQFFAGGIDDVRIYNRALTSAEIHNQYQWPSGGRP